MRWRAAGGLVHVAGRWWSRRRPNVLAGPVMAALLSVSLTGCGSSPSARKLTLSVACGPPGTVVLVSGNAGPGCVVGKNWPGFDFEPYGDLIEGPVVQMTTPVATNGFWSARFIVPAYLGGSPTRGPGAPTTPGRYEFVAPTCQAQAVGTASFRVTTARAASTGKAYVGMAATADGHGYWLAQADGGVAAFGDAAWHGSLPAERARPTAPVVGIARTADAKGYWLAGADGRVYGFGDAHLYAPAPADQAFSAPVTAIAGTPDGKGYWLLGADGSVHGYGDAPLDGGPDRYMAPYDALAARPTGGYVVSAASDAGSYLFPGGTLSTGGPGFALSASVVATAATPSGHGAWQVGLDGGVFTWGDAKFYGSLPGDDVTPEAPVAGMAATPDGRGYWFVGSDGNVFSFGDAHFYGFAGHPAK